MFYLTPRGKQLNWAVCSWNKISAFDICSKFFRNQNITDLLESRYPKLISAVNIVLFFLYTKSRNDRKKHSWQKTKALTWSRWGAGTKLSVLEGKRSSINLSKYSCNWWDTEWCQWFGECPGDWINPVLKSIHLPKHAFKQHLFKNKLYIQISPQNVSYTVYCYKCKASW